MTRTELLLHECHHSSVSGKSTRTIEFWHDVPWQIPHAEMHLKPFFLHEHPRLLQLVWQLQWFDSRSSCGAIGSKDGIGSNLFYSDNLQPYFRGSRCMDSRDIQSQSWQYARKECCLAAPSVGGSAWGFIFPEAACLEKAAYLVFGRDWCPEW